MKKTLLDRVRSKLAPLRGAKLEGVAFGTGISVDTLLRIKRGETDPAFGKVQRLAEHLRISRR